MSRPPDGLWGRLYQSPPPLPCPYPLLIQLLLLFGSSFDLGQTAGLVLQYTDEEIEALRGKRFPPNL